MHAGVPDDQAETEDSDANSTAAGAIYWLDWQAQPGVVTMLLCVQTIAGAAAAGDPLAVLIADSDGAVGWALQGFSLLALATSFIGTCTGTCRV